MKSFLVEQIPYLKGTVIVPGDKSIAHRYIIISAISQGKTTIKNFPYNQDCLSTIRAFKQLGVKIVPDIKSIKTKSTVTVFGKGRIGLKSPQRPIFVGDSGTTLRLVLGVLSGCNFKTRLVAGKSLSARPMLRVTEPLRLMGACILAKKKNKDNRREEFPPLTIQGGKLKPITYKLPVASAQVKSAILLAGLYANGLTEVIEPFKTRDHTERILKQFQASIKVEQNKINLLGNKKLISPKEVFVPADISSASFFIVLGIILGHSRLVIKNVCLNPTRTGVIEVLKRMGANIRIKRTKSLQKGAEPIGDVIAQSSRLKATTVHKAEIPSLIDELPILMVAASIAKGRTVFEGVSELRVKETDRINSMSENLRKMSVNVKLNKSEIGAEKIIIEGVKALQGARVRSFNDHRTAMSMVVAGLIAQGKTLIDDVGCINKSFPEFLRILYSLANITHPRQCGINTDTMS